MRKWKTQDKVVKQETYKTEQKAPVALKAAPAAQCKLVQHQNTMPEQP